MKQVIPNYTVNSSAKTITLTDFTTVRLDRIHLIVNVTTNTVLYNFADNTVSTATVSTNVITLSAMPSTADADKIQIVYDAKTGDPLYDLEKTSSSTGTGINASTNNTVILSSNANRKMAVFYNNSTATLYLKLGLIASTSSFTIKMDPGGYYELPHPVYTGEINAVWSTATGQCRVTEFV